MALWIFQPGIFVEKTLRLEELYLRPDESGGGRFELKGMGFRRDQVGGGPAGWGLGVGVAFWGGQPGELGFRGVQVVLRVQNKKHIIYRFPRRNSEAPQPNHIQTVQKLFFPFCAVLVLRVGRSLVNKLVVDI